MSACECVEAERHAAVIHQALLDLRTIYCPQIITHSDLSGVLILLGCAYIAEFLQITALVTRALSEFTPSYSQALLRFNPGAHKCGKLT